MYYTKVLYIVYIISTIYLGKTKGNFKRFYNHKKNLLAVIIIMTQHRPNTFGTSKKCTRKPQF